MYSVTEVVKNIIIINVIVFFTVKYLLPIPEWKTYFVLWHPNFNEYESGVFFHPIQFVTSMFNHANIPHLMFNMMALYSLGPYVERVLNPGRFLILYILAGLTGSILFLLITKTGAVGASGAIYGVLVAFATMFPKERLSLMFIPAYFPAKYIAIGLVLIDLFFGISKFNTGIGHFAHLGGALCGFLLVYYWGYVKLK